MSDSKNEYKTHPIEMESRLERSRLEAQITQKMIELGIDVSGIANEFEQFSFQNLKDYIEMIS